MAVTKDELRFIIEAKDKASAVYKKIDGETKKLKKSTASIVSTATKLGALFGAGLGIASVVGLFKKATSAAIAQEQAEAKLNAVLLSTKGAAGLTAEELKKMASELQKITIFGDEATIETQALLLTFTKIGKDVFPEALAIVQDMSIAMGTDMKSAAIQVGKALNDPILGATALSRSGIQFTDVQKDMIKGFVETGEVAKAQAIIMKELNTQFAGQAQAQAATFGGKITQLGNAFGDTLESIGGFITASGLVQAVIATLTDLFTKLNEATADFTQRQADLNEQIITNLKLEQQQILSRATITKLMAGMADSITFATEEDRKLFDINKQIIDTDNERIAGIEAKKAATEAGTTATTDQISETERLARAEAQRQSTLIDSAFEEIELAGSRRDELLAIEQEISDAKVEINKLELEQRIADQEAFVAQTKEVLNQADADFRKSEQTKQALIGVTSQILSRAGNVAQQIARATGNENRLLAGILKGVALAQIAFNTGIAVTQTLANPALAAVFPANLIAAGLIGALGIAEAVTVAATSFQTAPGEIKQVPGPPNRPVPAIVHGGELIGRPAGGMGVNIVVEGNIIGLDDSAETIRQSLFDLTRETGQPVEGSF